MCSGLHDARLLCLCGWDESDRAEQAAVVIPIDPLQRFPFDLAHQFARADLVDHLGFEQANDAFGQRMSQASPTVPTERLICALAGRSVYLIDRYCDPRSEW